MSMLYKLFKNFNWCMYQIEVTRCMTYIKCWRFTVTFNKIQPIAISTKYVYKHAAAGSIVRWFWIQPCAICYIKSRIKHTHIITLNKFVSTCINSLQVEIKMKYLNSTFNMIFLLISFPKGKMFMNLVHFTQTSQQ